MTRAGSLDALGFIGDGQRYEDLIEHTSEIQLGEHAIRILALEELIRQKQQMGRLKDLAAAELLEKILSLRSAPPRASN